MTSSSIQYEWFVFGSLINHSIRFSIQNLNAGICPVMNTCSATPQMEMTRKYHHLQYNTLLPAYITLNGSSSQKVLLQGYYEHNTLSVGEDISSPTDGTYGSPFHLKWSIIFADIDNDVSPQNFSLDVADGTVQTQDIFFWIHTSQSKQTYLTQIMAMSTSTILPQQCSIPI